jgi:flagellar basal-body rod protein FlgG
MIRGLYAAADGLLVQAARTDVIAGNLAGMSVPGFKRDVPTVTAFTRALEYTASQGAAGAPGGARLLVPSSVTDLQPGAQRHTGARFDVALEGPGFLCVQTPHGVAYTRSGALRLDTRHQLVTANGDPVLGQTGPITISGNSVEIRENGDVMVDGALADRIKMVDFPPGTPLQKIGNGLLVADASAAIPSPSARVRQGYLEAANVEAVTEMAAMISTLRAFEASQRAFQATDETLDKAINEVGRV